MVRIPGFSGRKRRSLGLLAGTAALILATALIYPAYAVLPGSPSLFESGNDPSTGLGNMVVNTAGNADWSTVQNEANYVELTDTAASNSDNSFTPGQKQDTVCPDVEGHKNPPKDDFTHVASFFEVNETTGDVYLYGATIRFAANGNASENIELKQGDNGLCPGSTTLLQRTPGDKLLAIDYLGGGSAPEFHVLTWDADGPCFVANNPAPCWGADVAELDPTEAEGGVNASAIPAAQNPISNANLVAGKFAEFGVNLSAAGILTPGSCEGFSQTIWESRSSGSSFVSSTKDITIEDQDIALCGSVEVTKVGSDGGSQAGAVFTLYEGTGTGGTVVGTCTVDAAGDCLPTFDDLQPGTYTIDETTVPAGYGKDPTLPFTFTLDAGETEQLSFTDTALEGALAIVKNSTKGGPVTAEGAVFSYNGSSVTDNGAGDEDSDVGEVCVSGLAPGDYSVDETTPPPGYGDAAGSAQTVTVVNGSDCTAENYPSGAAVATFTNPPLFDIQVNFADGGSGETSIVSIDCDGNTALDGTPATDWDASQTTEDIDFVDESGTGEMTIDCTLVVDP
ncbi:MAG: Cna domain protein [Actinomycetia bacterium]|nr:Cna domain protein [Actinomycetes bacterium]